VVKSSSPARMSFWRVAAPSRLEGEGEGVGDVIEEQCKR
jgi:hypothetical protein